MPDFFLELFSEEIPARMQHGAAAELARSVASALAPLSPANIETFFGPRLCEHPGANQHPRCHSMISSARADRPGGTSMPRAPAVFKLITNSNFVGC